MPEPIDVLHVSTAASEAELARIKASVRPGVDAVTYGMLEASHKFHGLLTRGLAAEGARVHSLVGRSIGGFHRRGWWPGSTETLPDGRTVEHLPVANLPIAKQACLALGLAGRTFAWRVRTRRNPRRVLVVDAAYVTALPGVLAALAGSGVVTLGLVMDVYPYMGDVTDARNRTEPGQDLLRRVAQACYARLDGLLLLTAAMSEVVNPAGRPTLVIDGLVDGDLVADESPVARDEHLTILYAGALRAEYGVANLVAAFRSLPEPDARLVVYGGGPYADAVAAAAREDARIDFRGHADVADVVAAERRAWLLVNPRPAGAEFTRFSFPSKVMEYLAAGTAVASTRLPGIPAEYFAHVVPIEGDDVDALRDALASALALGRDELARRGADGRAFVRASRTDRQQGRRILDLAARVARGRGARR